MSLNRLGGKKTTFWEYPLYEYVYNCTYNDNFFIIQSDLHRFPPLFPQDSNLQKVVSLDITEKKLYIRGYTSGNLRKSWSQGYCGQTALKILVVLFSRSLKIGVNFAFVLTPKSAVKSSRRTKFSSISISLLEIICFEERMK